ncbi:MAG: DUF3352 domain-containing protein [Chloroflexota bacterium]|nr:DUF3352 domain-containing protein [Chloroflexota bacterium]MDE2959301.1 DUF3352 domain-containing protein [Chloroflexota bacterium]
MLIKILGAIAAVIVIAIIVVGLAMWRGLIPIPGPLLALLVDAKGPEYSARYYPSDTLAYGWVTLTPGGGQFEDMRDIWERFDEYPKFRELVDELQADFLDETGIDFETEVMPWIGPEIGAALIDFDVAGETPTVLLTIGVRDKGAAGKFLAKWMEYTGEGNFDTGSHRGFDIWVNDEGTEAYALTNDWLVFATDERTLTGALDRIEDGGDSLADDANFMAAQAALPERRFSSFYLDYQQGLELLDDFVGGEFGTLMPGMIGPAAFTEQAPDWVAGSTGWVERGITMEMVSPTVSTFGLETVELRDPANLLPVDTLGFMAGAFDPDVDHWRTALGEYDLDSLLPYPGVIDEINDGVDEMAGGNAPELNADATLADALDLGFWLVKDLTGIDLEADFFDHLSGQAILAVQDFDFDAVMDDPTANAVDVVAMLSYQEDGKEGLDDTMDEVAKLLQNHAGLEASSVDVGANDDATVFDLGLLGMMVGGPIGYRPGYVLHDQYLTLGTTESALAAIVERQNGEGDGLSSDAEYQRATTHLATDGQFLGYVDLRRIVAQLDADDLDLEPEEYRILREGIGVAAFSSTTGEDYARGAAVLTLFPK